MTSDGKSVASVLQIALLNLNIELIGDDYVDILTN